MKKILVILLSLYGDILQATDPWYDNHEEGWHFYHDNIKSDELTNYINNEPSLKIEKDDPLYYSKTKDKMVARHTLNRDRLIVEPDNEKFYLEFLKDKKEMDNKLGKMLETHKKVTLKYPEYDLNRDAPKNQAMIELKQTEMDRILYEKIKPLTKEYDLIFFVLDGCQACDIFEKTVKEFVDKYGFNILPVSLNKSKKSSVFNYKKDNGIATNMKITEVPTLFIKKSKGDEYLPIATHSIPLQELEINVVSILSNH